MNLGTKRRMGGFAKFFGVVSIIGGAVYAFVGATAMPGISVVALGAVCVALGVVLD